MSDYSIPEITAEAVCACIEALDKREGDLKYLSTYINKTESYTRRAILIGTQLNLFNSNKNKFQLTTFSSSIIRKIEGDIKIIFQEALFNFKPYIQFIELISRGETKESSVRKIKAIYGIPNEGKIILKTFNNFSRFLKIELISDKLNHLFQEKKDYDKINKILSTIKNKFQSQLVISEKLGSSCFNYITNAERVLLVDSMLKAQSEPHNAIDDAAGSFESFLRRIGKDNSINLSNANGIGQVSQILSSNKNKILLSEHEKMCSFISAFRNPSTHKVNKISLQHWKINVDTGIELILLILTSMRSIHAYVLKKQLLL